MKSLQKMGAGAVLVLAMAGPALAVDTSKTYSSGILVGLFIGFCALIVMFQLMPTIMMLIGFVKGLFKSSEKQSRRLKNRA